MCLLLRESTLSIRKFARFVSQGKYGYLEEGTSRSLFWELTDTES